MKWMSRIIAPVVAAGLLALSLTSASADLLPLFSFAQADASVKDFTYSNATGLFSAVGDVSFNGLGAALPSGTYKLNLAGHTDGAPVGPGGPQPILIDTFTFTKVATGDVLTIVTTGDVFLSGVTATTASSAATDILLGNPIAYSSTLNGGLNLNLNPLAYPLAPARDWSITLSGITGGLPIGANPANFADFQAVISGNGSYTTPEPSSLAMLMGLGVTASLFALRRRNSA